MRFREPYGRALKFAFRASAFDVPITHRAAGLFPAARSDLRVVVVNRSVADAADPALRQLGSCRGPSPTLRPLG